MQPDLPALIARLETRAKVEVDVDGLSVWVPPRRLSSDGTLDFFQVLLAVVGIVLLQGCLYLALWSGAALVAAGMASGWLVLFGLKRLFHIPGSQLLFGPWGLKIRQGGREFRIDPAGLCSVDRDGPVVLIGAPDHCYPLHVEALRLEQRVAIEQLCRMFARWSDDAGDVPAALRELRRERA